MKIELLRSTFDETGAAGNRQHLTCFIVNDRIAIDAGSLAMACRAHHREAVRNIVLTHAHLDHIAGLPLFIDDLFSTLTSPIYVHASSETIAILERDVFNWHVYPKFLELENASGKVLEYKPFSLGIDIEVEDIKIRPLPVNHKVPSAGFLISESGTMVALTGDTSDMDEFWTEVNSSKNLSALLIECAFPNELADLAEVSYHLTPQRLDKELHNFHRTDVPIYVVNMKPMFREEIVEELAQIESRELMIFEPGKTYEF